MGIQKCKSLFLSHMGEYGDNDLHFCSPHTEQAYTARPQSVSCSVPDYLVTYYPAFAGTLCAKLPTDRQIAIGQAELT